MLNVVRIEQERSPVHSAEALVPHLLKAAPDTERARQVPADTVAMLREEGLLGLMAPRRFGGREESPAVMAQVIATLARGCGSTAWVYGVSVSQSWVVALFDLAVQEEVWANGPQAFISGTYAIVPAIQTVERVDGGFRINGRWGFGSGSDHADWHLVQFLAPADGDTPPSPHFALIPRGEFAMEDDWTAMGLAGTGSKTVVLDDVFVPAYRTLGYAGMNSGDTPGAAIHDSPLYRLPMMSVVPGGIAATTSGMARGALDSVLAAAKGKGGAANKFAENQLAQCWIGEAEGEIEAAELGIQDVLERLSATAAAGKTPTVEDRVRVRRRYAYAVRRSVEAMDRIFSCSGASGIMLSGHAQRAWRDVNAAARHMGLNWESYATQSGKMALGMEPGGLY